MLLNLDNVENVLINTSLHEQGKIILITQNDFVQSHFWRKIFFLGKGYFLKNIFTCMNILPSCMYVYHAHAWYLRKSLQGAGNWTLTLCKRSKCSQLRQFFSQANVAQVTCSCLASGQILTTQLPLLELQLPCLSAPYFSGAGDGTWSSIEVITFGCCTG